MLAVVKAVVGNCNLNNEVPAICELELIRPLFPDLTCLFCYPD